MRLTPFFFFFFHFFLSYSSSSSSSSPSLPSFLPSLLLSFSCCIFMSWVFFYRRATSKSSLKSGGCSHSHYFSLCLHVLLSPWPLSRSAPLFLFLLTASFHHRLGGLPGLEDHFALVLHFQRPLLSTTVSVSMHQSDNEARFGGEDRNVCVCVCSRWPEQRRCISFLYLVCDLKCGFSSLCSPQGRTAADLSGLAKSLCDALRACGTLI